MELSGSRVDKQNGVKRYKKNWGRLILLLFKSLVLTILIRIATESPGGGTDKRVEQDDNQSPIEMLAISKHTPPSSQSDYPGSLGGDACMAINETHGVDDEHLVGRQASPTYGFTHSYRYDSQNIPSGRAAEALVNIEQLNSRE